MTINSPFLASGVRNATRKIIHRKALRQTVNTQQLELLEKASEIDKLRAQLARMQNTTDEVTAEEDLQMEVAEGDGETKGDNGIQSNRQTHTVGYQDDEDILDVYDGAQVQEGREDASGNPDFTDPASDLENGLDSNALARLYPFVTCGTEKEMLEFQQQMEDKGKTVAVSNPLRDGTVAVYLIKDAPHQGFTRSSF